MKTYVKPDLYFEDFELSTHVAGGCIDSLNHAETSCSISLWDKMGLDETLFSSDNCDNDYAVFEGYCEFSGEDEGLISVFSS